MQVKQRPATKIHQKCRSKIKAQTESDNFSEKRATESTSAEKRANLKLERRKQNNSDHKRDKTDNR